ncbi:MAG: radical SAM protein [Chloroflexia bacterium]|nr:radical SAM protein [Chloroflexia bacterium]
MSPPRPAPIQRILDLLEQEQGAVHKDWGGRIPLALVFANHYHVAMANLGYQALYGLLNAPEDLVCERVTWEGWGQAPLSMESQRPLADFPVWAISMPFELDYIHLVDLIRQSGTPLWAQEREDGDPLLLGGGVAPSANPEPVAPFLDAIVVGEAEEVLDEILGVLRASSGVPRPQILAALAGIAGVYVPTLHDGSPIRRRWVRDLSTFATTSVVLTPQSEFGDVYLIEIARGCRWGCRFCLAGHLTRPPRFRSLEQLRPQIEEGLRYRERVGLVGAAVSDHPQLDEMVRAIRDLGGGFSVASLRADQLSPVLLEGLRQSGTRTLTLAPEVGSAGLARSINKGFGREELLRAVDMAVRAGLHRLKLYFMIGLPGETDEDIRAIAALVREVRERQGGGSLSLSVTPFVPKAHTPLQWAPMAPAEALERRRQWLGGELRPLRIAVEGESVDWSRVQGVLARGDRRLAGVLAAMKKRSLGQWRRALRQAGLSEEEYLRQREPQEAFPWEIIEPGVGRDYLWREWQRARQGRPSPPCDPEAGCSRCALGPSCTGSPPAL